MKRLLALLLFFGAINTALAQPVQQSGIITPGHGTRWVGDGIIADAGTAADPSNTSLGATPGPICVNSGPITGPYNALCLLSSSTGGILSLNNIGGATGGISFEVNGTAQAFPSIILPTITGRGACWSDTIGTLTNCVSGTTVASLGGSTGVITLGSGLSIGSNILSNSGVLTFGGATGAITVSTGLTFAANTLSNAGVLSLGASTGTITLGSGLSIATNVLSNSGVLTFGGATGAITVSTGLSLVGQAVSNSGVLSLAGLTGAFTCTTTTGVTCAGNAVALSLTAFIPALTNLPTPDVNLDYVIVYDHTGSTKKATVGSIASAATSGVTSLGGQTGVLTCGTGITCAASDVSVNLTPVFSALATKAVPVTADYVIIYDVAGAAAKRSLFSTLPVVLTVGGAVGAITCSSGIACSAGTITNDFLTYIPALTAKTTPSAVNDYMILYDAAGAAIKKVNSASLGIDACTGVRSAKTTTYTVAAGDNHTLLSLGGTAFYTVALPAASGFTGNFSVCLHNTDTSRAKFITIDSGVNFYLWPLQTAVAYNDNNSWALRRDIAWRTPSGVLNLYTDYTLGADTNDCLAPGAGNACKSIQGALYLSCDNFYLRGTAGGQTQVVVNTATNNVDLDGIHYSCRTQTGSQGGAAISINGGFNSSIAPVGTTAIDVFMPGNVLELTGSMTISSGAGNAVSAALGAKIYISGTGIIFGTTSNAHISSVNAGSEIFMNATAYQISGPASIHITAQNQGIVTGLQTTTATWSTNASFTFFALTVTGGVISIPNQTYNCNTFACNGQRYNAANFSMIYTATGSATYFPGNVAGTASAATGGFYN